MYSLVFILCSFHLCLGLVMMNLLLLIVRFVVRKNFVVCGLCVNRLFISFFAWPLGCMVLLAEFVNPVLSVMFVLLKVLIVDVIFF